MSSYYDSSGNILSDLLDGKAEAEAKKYVVWDKEHKNRPAKFLITSSQLRRFFGELRQLEKKVNDRGFDAVIPLIKMVKSKASYAANPSKQKIPNSFKDFLFKNINEIHSRKDFEAFMLHFEAVVGFLYGMGLKNN